MTAVQHRVAFDGGMLCTHPASPLLLGGGSRGPSCLLAFDGSMSRASHMLTRSKLDPLSFARFPSSTQVY
jgi:hypothetical protein